MPRPHFSPLLILFVILSITLVAFPLCLGLVFGARRVDLFHATLFDACAMRSQDLHWQNMERVTQTLRYDFTLAADSFFLIEVWVADGPTLSFSQRLLKAC